MYNQLPILDLLDGRLEGVKERLGFLEDNWAVPPGVELAERCVPVPFAPFK